MIWTTSLEVSRTLKEMGVELESHFLWNEYTTPTTWWCVNAVEWNEINLPTETIPAYTLDQMYKVLEQVGKVKGWGYDWVCGFCGNGDCGHDGKWCSLTDYHYLRLCEAVPLGKGDEVLKDILKHV